MSNNLLSKRIDNYFSKLSKQNNRPKSGGGIYESFIKPNALMIFLLIIIITIIICYCYLKMEKNNIIIENNEKDKFVSNYKSLGNYQEINNRDKILTKVDDINVEAPYV